VRCLTCHLGVDIWDVSHLNEGMTDTDRPVHRVTAFAERSDVHSYAVSLAVEDATDRGLHEPESYWSDEADAYWTEILIYAESTIDAGELDR
jgi:hypothetical protein